MRSLELERTPAIDRAKLRAAVRRLGNEYVFYMLNDALDALPPAKLAKVVRQYICLERLQPEPNASTGRSLVDDVKAFDAAARRHEYYVSFDVNSKNCMEISSGTRAFIEDCRRLLDRCVAATSKGDPAHTREAFDTIFALFRLIDRGDEIIFFADEGGSWQVGVDWKKVFPAWFRSLAKTAEPEEFARIVVETVDAFERHDRAKHLAAARKLATAAQRRALDTRAACAGAR
jgi:hypothetical protein